MTSPTPEEQPAGHKRSKASTRYRRTTILGVLAMASLIWVAIDQFDIPAEEMAWLMLYTVVVVGIVIAIAGVAVALLILLRRWFGRDD